MISARPPLIQLLVAKGVTYRAVRAVDCLRPGRLFCSWKAHKFSANTMKLPDIYADWRIVAGVALIVLGAFNWEIGRDRTQEYSRIVAATPDVTADEAYRSFEDLDPRTDGAVLAPFTDAQRQVSYATARMDFYHATFLTGQALVLAGVVLTLAGFIVLIRRDSRHMHRRMRLGPTFGGNGPPL